MDGRIGDHLGRGHLRHHPVPPPTPERRLHRLAFEQAGYFTVEQVLGAGFSADDIRARLADGDWERIGRDVFRFPQWPHSETEVYAKWCLWCGGVGVISHQSAADLHGLGNMHPYFVHVIAPETVYSSAPQIVVHHTALGADDIQRSGTFRLTTPLRTVSDLATTEIAQAELDTAVRDGLEAGCFTRDELVERSDQLPSPDAERLAHAVLGG